MSTTEEMNLEIQEAIKKSLPNQVGEALKQRLEQADKDAKELKAQKDLNLHLQDLNENQYSQINGYKKLDERNSKLEAREKVCEEQELNLKLTIAELKLAEAEKRNVDMVNLTALVFKSPVYKEFISETQHGMTQWNQSTNRNEFSPTGGGTKIIEKTEN